MISPNNIRLQAVTPTRITRFLGLNKAEEGETELKLGEATETQNFRITNGYEIRKMEGWKDIFDPLGSAKINGMWSGRINGTEVLIFVYGSTLKRFANGVISNIGTTNGGRISFFYFGSKLYIKGKGIYKVYDGSELKNVSEVAYVPKIAINALPTGGGTVFEQINMLTGKKRMTFNGDGTAKAFQLPETDVTNVTATVDGESKTTTQNLAKGTVTFAAAPATGTGNVEITWEKNNSEDVANILNCTDAFIYGGSSDTRVFLFGNEAHKNREYYSGVSTIPDPTYFPANNYKDIGTDQYAITGMARQYDTQLIFKENETWYAHIDSSYDATNIMITDFPAYPLNSEKGNIAQAQARVLLNNPVTICTDGVYMWRSSNIRSEINTSKISQRLGKEFEELDLTEAVTYDWEYKQEYWICIPSKSKCWIYNYGNDTWYTRTNVRAYKFITVNDELYFATDGVIRKFDDECRYDGDDTAIDAIYETGFYGFNAEWRKKNIRKMWTAVKPETKVYAQYSYTTDNQNETVIGDVNYNVIDFEHVDFGHFTFNTSLTVKPFRFKLKAKKFAYLKLKIRSNKKTERATVLNVDLKETEGGEIK